MIGLVIFDCDGVLIDSEIISAGALVEELAQHGIAIGMSHVLENFIGHPYPVVAGKIAALAGAPLPASFETDYRARLVQRFDAELRPMPGILDVLDQLAVPFWRRHQFPSGTRAALAARGRPHRAFRRACLHRLDGGAAQARAGSFPACRQGDAGRSETLPGDRGQRPRYRGGAGGGMIAWQFTGGSHYQACHRIPHPTSHPIAAFTTCSTFFAAAPQLKRLFPNASASD
jgi:hypothetical protein